MCSDSMLARMFSGSYSVRKDEQGRYFVDRDGAHVPESLLDLFARDMLVVALSLFSRQSLLIPNVCCRDALSSHPQLSP